MPIILQKGQKVDLTKGNPSLSSTCDCRFGLGRQ